MVPPVDAVVQRLTSLEARYVDRDTEFNKCLVDLETLYVAHIKDEHDDRVATLEAATTELASWCPEVDNVLNNIKWWSRSWSGTSTMPCSMICPTGLVSFRLHLWQSRDHRPTGFNSDQPYGHHVELTPRYMSSEVVMTLMHVLAKATSPNPAISIPHSPILGPRPPPVVPPVRRLPLHVLLDPLAYPIQPVICPNCNFLVSTAKILGGGAPLVEKYFNMLYEGP